MSKYQKHGPKTPITKSERQFLKTAIHKENLSVTDYARMYGITPSLVYAVLNETIFTHTKTSRKLFEVIGYANSENKDDGHTQGASAEVSGTGA